MPACATCRIASQPGPFGHVRRLRIFTGCPAIHGSSRPIAGAHDIEVIFVDEPDAIIIPLGIKAMGGIRIVGTATAIANGACSTCPSHWTSCTGDRHECRIFL
jgi:hypothetical protein